MAKIHRFIGDFELNKKELEITGEVAKQIVLILKLKPGEKIELCDGKGMCAMTEIQKINKKSVLVKMEDFLESKENKNTVTLFCSVLKKENFEMVVQKATECGVSKIVPIISARTVKTGLNMERLQKIAREASEQSGRIDVPEISEPVKFSEIIKKTENRSVLFDGNVELFYKTPWERDGASTRNFLAKKYPCVLEDNSSRTCNINIWIGPEGGWTPEEIALARENNFQITSLGPLTLRGETAAVIATYLARNMLL